MLSQGNVFRKAKNISTFRKHLFHLAVVGAVLEELGYSLAGSWTLTVRAEPSQRLEDEPPLGEAWMGNLEVGGVELEGVVEEDVDIDGSRLVVPLPVGRRDLVTFPAEGVFDIVQSL